MSVIKKRNLDVNAQGILSEFDIENEYFINFVNLELPEKEHVHRFIEFVYTFNGKGVHTVDGREYPVQSGDMIIINHNCKHAVTPVKNLQYADIMLKPEYVDGTLRGTNDIFLLLTLEEFSELSNGVDHEKLLIHFDDEERKKIEFIINLTREEQRSGLTGGEGMLHLSLSMLLIMVFRKMSENQGSKFAVNDKLLSFMERNCGSNISLAEIAAKCGYTPEHFSRIFKKYTGKTPSAYLNVCRINRAKSLLGKTDKSVDFIMYECGFSNRTAFFKKFREQVGCTPLQFRKNQK